MPRVLIAIYYITENLCDEIRESLDDSREYAWIRCMHKSWFTVIYFWVYKLCIYSRVVLLRMISCLGRAQTWSRERSCLTVTPSSSSVAAARARGGVAMLWLKYIDEHRSYYSAAGASASAFHINFGSYIYNKFYNYMWSDVYVQILMYNTHTHTIHSFMYCIC